jgi:hypothetical protein
MHPPASPFGQKTVGKIHHRRPDMWTFFKIGNIPCFNMKKIFNFKYGHLDCTVVRTVNSWKYHISKIRLETWYCGDINGHVTLKGDFMEPPETRLKILPVLTCELYTSLLHFTTFFWSQTSWRHSRVDFDWRQRLQSNFSFSKQFRSYYETWMLKAKETKKCHHRDDDDDLVEFCQLWGMRTLLCYGLSADSAAPVVGADWAVT